MKQMVKNVAHALVPWVAGYLLQVKGYTLPAVERLMESFNISALQLAEGGMFNK